ncbi:hypothetical protein F5883DRAFT_621453 [Diaporthe sp. PMI_573]|nr:hypothetical protein F5883DRAFT_621453 [Diaporthaceae sp. PMI_573]
MTNSPRCPFSGSFTSGPIPAPGTHQDQFAAVLCPSRYSSMPTPPMGMELSMSAPSPNPSLQHPSTFNMHFAAPGVATLEALPAPDRVASYVPPDVGSPQVISTGRSVYSNKGRGPAVPVQGAPATTWLSFECQRRHFNPRFKIKRTFAEDGRPNYQCSVTVKGHVINSNTLFSNTADAKTHVAEQALSYIRNNLPRSGLATSYSRARAKADDKNQTPLGPGGVDA